MTIIINRQQCRQLAADWAGWITVGLADESREPAAVAGLVRLSSSRLAR